MTANIDWTRPVENMDGIPLRLVSEDELDAETSNPDQAGDRYLVPADYPKLVGGRWPLDVGIISRPDGRHWLTRKCVVRNVAEQSA